MMACEAAPRLVAQRGLEQRYDYMNITELLYALSLGAGMRGGEQAKSAEALKRSYIRLQKFCGRPPP